MPTIEQIEPSIGDGDLLVLTKLSQSLIMGTNEGDCEHKATYLDRLVGLMRSSIWLED